ATTGQALRDSVDLVVVAPWKGQQFSSKIFKPCSLPWKSNRATLEQVGLRNHTRTLIRLGLVRGDINRLFAQALDETAADGRVLDQQRGWIMALLDFHDLPFQRAERKPATHHLENVEDLLAHQQNDASRVIARFGFAQGDIPAHDEPVTRLPTDGVIGRQP